MGAPSAGAVPNKPYDVHMHQRAVAPRYLVEQQQMDRRDAGTEFAAAQPFACRPCIETGPAARYASQAA
jgi:hypothetical protein